MQTKHPTKVTTKTDKNLDKEIDNNEVTIRLRGVEILGAIKTESLNDYIAQKINKSKEINLK